jgi:hypothetical protein
MLSVSYLESTKGEPRCKEMHEKKYTEMDS